MYCFKYCGLKDIHFGMLARGEVFFASPEELNDGSECRPRYVLKGSAELWERLCEFILFEAWIQTQDGRPTDPEGAKALLALAKPLAAKLRRRAGRRDMDFDELWPLVSEELPPLLAETNVALATHVLIELTRRVIRGPLTRNLREESYVASFSLDPRVPTMWGHYAAAERGFCLILHAPGEEISIRSPADVFPDVRPSPEHPGMSDLGSYDDALVSLQPVIYRNSPPRVNAFHTLIPTFHYSEEEEHYDVPLLLPGDAPVREQEKFGLVKAKTWKYENEVRALFPGWEKLPPEARCVRLAERHFAGLIFGPKMTPANKQRAIVAAYLGRAGDKAAAGQDRPFVFLEAVQRVDRFQMGLRVMGVLGPIFGHGVLPFTGIDRLDDDAVATTQRLLEAITERPE